MPDAALCRERAQHLQVLSVKAQRNLLRARWANLDAEVFQILGELLDAVARPEVTLFSVASERGDPGLLCGCRCTH
jgi:hypothetical protein